MKNSQKTKITILYTSNWIFGDNFWFSNSVLELFDFARARFSDFQSLENIALCSKHSKCILERLSPNTIWSIFFMTYQCQVSKVNFWYHFGSFSSFSIGSSAIFHTWIVKQHVVLLLCKSYAMEFHLASTSSFIIALKIADYSATFTDFVNQLYRLWRCFTRHTLCLKIAKNVAFDFSYFGKFWIFN